MRDNDINDLMIVPLRIEVLLIKFRVNGNSRWRPLKGERTVGQCRQLALS
jgi:hypothetical protein